MSKHRNLTPAMVPVLLAALLGGCASTPDQETAATQEGQSASRGMAEAQPAPYPSEPLAVRPDHPTRYVVQPGDTLWTIASRFLREPWRWPELWQDNPSVRDPHRIYPGDILSIVHIDGKPQLRVQKGGDINLSPKVRVEELDQAIPTIPYEAIHQFLAGHRVLSEQELDEAAYVLAFSDEHIGGGAGDRIYARGIEGDEPASWVILRRGQAYRDFDSEEVLGYEATFVGNARLVRSGDPSTLDLTSTGREVLLGDRLFPAEEEQYLSFLPRAPEQETEGRILAVVDGVSQIGQYQIVALDLGAEDGIERGHVLATERSVRDIRDLERGGEVVTLPRERSGVAMVFKVFDKMSYALLMQATRAIHVGDHVTRP